MIGITPSPHMPDAERQTLFLNFKERRPQALSATIIPPVMAGCRGGRLQSPPRRRENSTGNWKIVTLRKNRNSSGAKILFLEKFRFWMFFGGTKSRVAGASATR